MVETRPGAFPNRPRPELLADTAPRAKTGPYKFIGFGAKDATKPHKFIGFGAMYATKPHKFIGFGTELIERLEERAATYKAK